MRAQLTLGYMEQPDFNRVRLDGVLWERQGRCDYEPVCPSHFIRLIHRTNNFNSCILECAEDKETFVFSREYTEQKDYIKEKVESKYRQQLKYVDIDGEYVAIAQDKVSSEDSNYFVTARLTQSKVGLRLVVYAGEKGKEKTQIFVDPEIKKLAFDQTNTHPNEVFVALEATFDDGSKARISQD